jgi:hypothetical protein
MPPTPVEPVDAEDAPKPEVTYASAPTGASVSRRQFRFLLTLTLLNTLLLTAFVAGPATSRMVAASREKYRQWKIQRDEAAAHQKFNTDFTAALTRSIPSGTVVYDDHPDCAAALLAKGSDYRPVPQGSTVYFPPKPWQLPTGFYPSSPAFQVGTDSDHPTVFATGRRTPGGTDRLILVSLESDQTMERTPSPESHATTQRFGVRHTRAFRAHVLFPFFGRLEQRMTRSLEILQPADHQTTITWTKGTSWENGRVDADLKGVLRVFAGQADPADPSHFTIPYDLDDQPGVIDGWLRDDEVVLLQPRTGRVVDQDVPYARKRLWNPYAEPPTSRPADPLPPLVPVGQR